MMEEFGCLTGGQIRFWGHSCCGGKKAVAWLSENTAHCLGIPFDSYSMFSPIRSLQIFIFLSNMTLWANLFSGAKHRYSFTVAPMICDQARPQAAADLTTSACDFVQQSLLGK